MKNVNLLDISFTFLEYRGVQMTCITTEVLSGISNRIRSFQFNKKVLSIIIFYLAPEFVP